MANTNTRLTAGMTVKDMILVMSEDNIGASTCLMEMIMADPMSGMLDILLLDALGIYGPKIYLIWNDCCGCDLDKLRETFTAFREGKFTKKEIHENLSQLVATPFV